MNAITVKRLELHAAIELYALKPWRVHQYAPAQVVAPCVFIDAPSLDDVSPLLEVTLPVVVTHDGSIEAQTAALDELVARLWTAAATVGRPTSSNPVVLDVGGPTLRAQVVRVACTVAATSLCPLDLITS